MVYYNSAKLLEKSEVVSCSNKQVATLGQTRAEVRTEKKGLFNSIEWQHGRYVDADVATTSAFRSGSFPSPNPQQWLLCGPFDGPTSIAICVIYTISNCIYIWIWYPNELSFFFFNNKNDEPKTELELNFLFWPEEQEQN